MGRSPPGATSSWACRLPTDPPDAVWLSPSQHARSDLSEPHNVTAGDRPDATLSAATDAVVRVLLACVCGTAGATVAVVGDGAVGLSAVLAAKRLGAERIIALSRHADRQQLARDFGATDIVAARGEEAVAALSELTGGIGADATMECVGTGQAMETALAITRPGAMDERRAIKSLVRVGGI